MEASAEGWGTHDLGPCGIPNFKLCLVLPAASEVPL